MAERVEVRKYKWPDRFIDTQMERVLGEDRFGVWHGVLAGEGGTGSDGVTWRLLHSVAICFPSDRWWIAGFDSEGVIGADVTRDGVTTRHEFTPRDIYVHIAMPAHRESGLVTWMDLEIDVIRNRDGSVVVIDEDEFEAVEFPLDVARKARAARDDVVRMMRAPDEPFRSVGRRWLDRLVAGEFEVSAVPPR